MTVADGEELKSKQNVGKLGTFTKDIEDGLS